MLEKLLANSCIFSKSSLTVTGQIMRIGYLRSNPFKSLKKAFTLLLSSSFKFSK
ncbi:hypothetical protein CY0110_16297 [Crocosphaera chwakensis CCY0110]|uniref:Uncharacterized protein n=1 Tax=Crocosphaera chwakensis CCY0110 TaxID=391612 RepID=A3IHU1_9CHRO|nr:hypothetical protein CY0110_16297 [Crocosphaera chwakensis CCY0110]